MDWALQLAKPFASLGGKSEKLQEISGWRRELMSQPLARSFLISRMRWEDAVDTVEKEIHQVQILTLVIAADSDETIPLWHCETYTKEIPGAELVIIPNSTTHGLPQAQAQIMTKLISKFLDN